MWAHPGKQLLFMGVEIGQESEWAESRELDWWLLDHPEHRGVQSTGARPQRGVRRDARAVGRDDDPAGFQWIDANDAGRNTFSFVRRGPRRARPGLRLELLGRAARRSGSGCPSAGDWDEVVNTDAEAYTGSGVGNLGSVTAHEGEWSGQPAHADLVVPPLATIWLRRRD